MASNSTIPQQIYLDWGQDLVLTNTGGLQWSSGFDAVRQSISRLLLTNPSTTEPSGLKIVADYLFEPQYGLGLRAFVGQLGVPNVLASMQLKCQQAIAANPAVAQTPAPTVTFLIPNTYTLEIFIDLYMANQTPGTTALSMGLEVTP